MKNLRAAREAKKITQDKLAGMCDIIIVMLMVFGAAVVCFLAAHCSYVWVRPLN